MENQEQQPVIGREMTIDEVRESFGKKERTFQMAWRTAGNENYQKNRIASREEKLRMVSYYAKDGASNPKRGERMRQQVQARMAKVAAYQPPPDEIFKEQQERLDREWAGVGMRLEQLADVLARIEAAKQMDPLPVQDPTEEIKAAPGSKFAFKWNWLLDGINIAEMGFAFLGFCLLFKWFGVLPGLVCIAFYAHSTHVMKTAETWADSATLSKIICFVLSGVFAWIHGQTFWLGLTKFRPEIPDRLWVAVFASALISGLSLAALLQNRNIKTAQ